MSISAEQLWAVVPCKGRLSFLQQTAPALLKDARVHYCLVDYACPEGSGRHLLSQFASVAQQGRLLVETVSAGATFNKSHAHNLGAQRAIAAGASYLCFLDADTLVRQGFLDWVCAHAKAETFCIAGPDQFGRSIRSMTGLLGISREAFTQSGGFDESFEGWGAEDIEMRVRLFHVMGLDFEEIPSLLTDPIPHDDALRTEFYREKSLRLSNARNLARVKNMLLRSTLLRRSDSRSSRLWAGVPEPLWLREPRHPDLSVTARELSHATEPLPELPAPQVNCSPQNGCSPRSRNIRRAFVSVAAHIGVDGGRRAPQSVGIAPQDLGVVARARATVDKDGTFAAECSDSSIETVRAR